MSDTPGEVRIRIDVTGGRPPIAAAGTALDDGFGVAALDDGFGVAALDDGFGVAALDDAFGGAAAERRCGALGAPFGAPTATDALESDAERHRIERNQSRPT